MSDEMKFVLELFYAVKRNEKTPEQALEELNVELNKVEE